MLVFLFAEADGENRIAADSHDHRHCHDEQGDGEAYRDAPDAEAAHALPHEIAVHDVVERLDEHADDGGHRELQDNLGDAGRPHRVQFLIFERILHFGAQI